MSNSDSHVGDLLLALTNFGSSDLAQAVTWLDKSEIEYQDFSRFVFEYCNSTGVNFLALDIAAIALECIAAKAGAEDLRYQIHTNFLCSCFDTSEEEAGEILYRVEEDERNAAWKFLLDFTDAIEREADESELVGQE